MSANCQMVVFSNKAYNAIIRESFDKDPVETGGILLGHVLDNGVWIVMEVLPPGLQCIFETAYFEYDDAFVNYLAQSVANQYKRPLDLLGLWHRHPGSMDVFSTTDDGTNATFARQNPRGVISGLVNIDPRFRLTMYHMDNPGNVRLMHRPYYQQVPIEVGDDIIPEEYFELRYYAGDGSNLNPQLQSSGQRLSRTVQSAGATSNIHPSGANRPMPDSGDYQQDYQNYGDQEKAGGFINDLGDVINTLRKKWLPSLLLLLALGLSVFSVGWFLGNYKINEFSGLGQDNYSTSYYDPSDELEPVASAKIKTEMLEGERVPLERFGHKLILNKSLDERIVRIIDGKVVGVAPGKTYVLAMSQPDIIEYVYEIEVKENPYLEKEPNENPNTQNDTPEPQINTPTDNLPDFPFGLAEGQLPQSQGSYPVKAIIKPEYATLLESTTWASGNPEIATVENGRIILKAKGKTIIIATAPGYKPTEYKLTVK